MFRMTKKETVFFDLFSQACERSNIAACALEELMLDYTNIEVKIQAIECMEHDCDLLVHETMEYLNKSFITPIDREDIYAIAKEIDNIVDEIEAIAHRFTMFNVKTIRPEALELSKLIIEATRELTELMNELVNMKKSKEILQKIIEVNRIENEGDVIYRNAITKLFANETDPLEVIKWKSMFEHLENALDACEDVANIVEGVVMKHA